MAENLFKIEFVFKDVKNESDRNSHWEFQFRFAEVWDISRKCFIPVANMKLDSPTIAILRDKLVYFSYQDTHNLVLCSMNTTSNNMCKGYDWWLKTLEQCDEMQNQRCMYQISSSGVSQIQKRIITDGIRQSVASKYECGTSSHGEGLIFFEKYGDVISTPLVFGIK